MADKKSKETLVYELMMAVRKLTRSSLMLQYAVAEKMNLNTTDAECIDFLMEMGPSSAGDLAKVTRLTTGAITNVIDRLEKAGFVKRENDPQDRRKVIIRYVSKKHEKAKQYYDAMAADVYALFSGYTESNLTFLSQHSGKLTEIFHSHAEKIFKNKPLKKS
jgi:MarR family transcriptional regulator, organic hydroperoxide resistance regulator